jgi:asparagine synthase (glutamine-hydrolysing)
VLDEKHVLKGVGRDLIPDAILHRKKQPYRAPDALSFVGSSAPGWLDDVVEDRALQSCGVFDLPSVKRLVEKCRASRDAQFSNADNMALVGVLSTQLLSKALVETRWSPSAGTDAPRTLIDRTGEQSPLFTGGYTS